MSSQRKSGGVKDNHSTIMMEFEPTTNYLYEKLKHAIKCNSKTDRLNAYLKRKQQWENDPFIYHNHVRHNNQSKEGRKLMLCEFNNKKLNSSTVLKKNSNIAPFSKLSHYVIPSENKRDDLRYEIRMKMLRSSFMDFQKPYPKPQQVKKLPIQGKALRISVQLKEEELRELEIVDLLLPEEIQLIKVLFSKYQKIIARKRDDKREEKKQTLDLRSRKRGRSPSSSSQYSQDSDQKVQINGKNLSKTSQQKGDFKNFPEIHPKTAEGLKKRGIEFLFPVQYESFLSAYNREDLIVRDLTGSGKTLAFSLPMVEYLRKNKCFGSGKIQGIVLAPTRELALQVSKEINNLKHFESEYNVLTVYGGVSIDDQTRELRRGVDIFVGTTGRVLDHMERKNFNFSELKTIVLDEADQMLKLGFKEDVEKIMTNIKEKAPRDIQVLLFSATVPRWVKNVAENYLAPNFRMIDLAQNLKNKTASTVNHLAINCPYHNRMSALADVLIIYGGLGQTIVFCSTKQEANSLLLTDKIKQDIEVMHGDIAQNQREVTLKRFKEQKFSVLVATDVASRGLDIPNVDLVIQVEPPKEVETYIHRAGRTARAGRDGTCITFYTKKHMPLIQQIEQRAGIKFNKIGIPQPEEVIKASSRDIIKNLKEVNDQVIPLFEEAAETLIRSYEGDAKAALSATLAYLSGHYKQILGNRSLLTGQEKYITVEMRFKQPFYAVSFVWNILRRSLPQNIHEQIRGMRAFKEMNGVVFDVPDDFIERFEDIFSHMKSERRIDYDIERAKQLPELKEDESQAMQGNGRDQRGGGYGYGQNRSQSGYDTRNHGQYQPRTYGGGDRRDYSNNGDRYQGGGSRGGKQDDAKTVFMGNLSYNMDERDVDDFFRQQNLRSSKVRLVKDQQGQFKGAAFVEFDTESDAKKACGMNGLSFGDQRRPVRINPAGSKPSR